MRNKSKQIPCRILYLALFIMGLCMGSLLCCGIHLWRNRTDRAQTQTALSEKQEANLSEHKETVWTQERETPASEATEAAEIIVDYPFFSSEEGWSLVLRESGKEDAQDGNPVERRFCLYDGNGQLLQEFPCGIAAKDLIFRFDQLSHYYGYDADLIVFPEEAQEKGAEGLCYSWDDEEKNFAEEPINIPWYQEGSLRDGAFMVCGVEGDDTEENVETKAIYRINERTRELVELRRWTVRKDAETGEESLCIRDCLEGQDIYTGNVIRYDTEDLKNEKYYQYLFWEGLEKFGDDENDSPIRFCNEHLEQAEYEDKQTFLADHGLAGAEPFYEYCDRFGNLIMELYFDQQTGKGCGIRYYYSFNDKLEKRATRDGFAFEEVETGGWEPQEAFSKLTVYGDDVSKYASGYKEIYEYTDDDKISSFEARGMDLADRVPMEVGLLSLNYIYRDDGTLYHKEYYHYPKFFSSTGYSQSGDYDEQGRPVYRSGYITHCEMQEYFLYEGDSMEPDYCLFLDWGPSNSAYVRMIAYDSAD